MKEEEDKAAFIRKHYGKLIAKLWRAFGRHYILQITPKSATNKYNSNIREEYKLLYPIFGFNSGKIASNGY